MEKHQDNVLTPEELEEQKAEELPAREVMTTLPLELWGTPGVPRAAVPTDVDPEEDADAVT